MNITTRKIPVAPDISLAADIAGPAGGPTVILMHGGGQTRHSWRGAMRGLAAQGYRVVSYDARGHGDSDWSAKGDYSVRSLAADLDQLIAALALPRPIALAGASMGGLTAFYSLGASAAPSADVLIMVDITLRPAPEGARKIMQFMRANSGGFASLEDAADAVSAYNPDRPRPSDPSGLRKNLRERDGRLFWHWDPRLVAMTPSSEPPDFTAALIEVSGRVTVPTLLVRGGHSDIVDDDGVAELIRLVPQTQIHNVPGAGHMVAGDRNDAFNAAILAFLEQHMPLRQPAEDIKSISDIIP